MTNKDKLIQMINNLNENGIDLITRLFSDMDKNEKYNKFTTPEKLAELLEIEKQKEEQRKEQLKADREKTSLERARAEYKRQEEFKASLTGKEKRLLEIIKSVQPGYYSMEFWELMLLSDIYNKNLINGSTDLFNYGFLKGQRAEKARQKRIREKAKAS